VGAPPGPPYYGVDWLDDLERTPLVAELLTRGQLRVEWWLKQRASAVRLQLPVIAGFHRETFTAVFPEFAGRLRGPAPQHIPRNVSFGRFRGVASDLVPAECDALSVLVGRYISQLDGYQGVAEQAYEWFSDQVLRVAAFTHCELIRIHPFVNGNGRVARTCINYFAWRYGFLPVPFERPKGEYLDAIEVWLRQSRIEPFADYLRPQWLQDR
jgi:fido (protein-threonine AMPylation protein)